MTSGAEANIIKHAREAFLTAPYARVSIREIAVRSGYSHTYVHRLFKNKKQLFQRVYREAASDIRAAMNLRPEDDARVIMLKVLSVNPLQHPVVLLLQKSASDEDLRQDLIEAWSDDPGSGGALTQILAPLFAQGEQRLDFFRHSSTNIGAGSLCVFGLLLIWAQPAADLLADLSAGLVDPQAFKTGPQELLLGFLDSLSTLSQQEIQQ